MFDIETKIVSRLDKMNSKLDSIIRLLDILVDLAKQLLNGKKSTKI